MEDPLSTSLIVTGIGMVILLAAMALLYGLMVAMTALIKDRDGHEAPPLEGTEEGDFKDEEKLKVAAVAVALARAELERSLRAPAQTSTGASSWRQIHLQRLLNHPRHRGRGR